MSVPETLNQSAHRLVEAMIERADELRIRIHRIANGARVIDCGIQAQGGLQAGLQMARVCLAGRAEVGVQMNAAGDLPLPNIRIVSDQPVLACMASQYAGWQIGVGKYFAMGSGPMRALYGKESLYQQIPGSEQSSVAVGVLETRKLPNDAVIDYLCTRLVVAADNLTLLAAPAASMAGGIQVVARSLETALHKLYELKFDLKQVVSGMGAAPLPPPAAAEIQAIGRSNDAILYGGRVVLWVDAEDDELAAIGPKVPSSASSDHGEPFAAIFERSGGDFYKIDPMLFSPAVIVFQNLRTGRCFRFGRCDPGILERSFFGE